MRAPRLRVRELRNPAEYAEASQVAKAAWGFVDLMVPPPPDMITATHSGGMTAGAFEGDRLLAFVHAVPRRNLPQPAIHSHLLAVRPDAQRRGLSVRLKLFQREWCLARGISLVTWTYDPFMLRNARLNLVRLGGTVPPLPPELLRGDRRDLRRVAERPVRGALEARERRRREGRSGRDGGAPGGGGEPPPRRHAAGVFRRRAASSCRSRPASPRSFATTSRRGWRRGAASAGRRRPSSPGASRPSRSS